MRLQVASLRLVSPMHRERVAAPADECGPAIETVPPVADVHGGIVHGWRTARRLIGIATKPAEGDVADGDVAHPVGQPSISARMLLSLAREARASRSQHDLQNDQRSRPAGGVRPTRATSRTVGRSRLNGSSGAGPSRSGAWPDGSAGNPP